MSAFMFGFQHIAFLCGPKAMHLATIHVHKLAEMTSIMFIYESDCHLNMMIYVLEM